MSRPVASCLFGLDVGVVMIAGWLLASLLGSRAKGVLEPLVAWLGCVIGLVVASGLAIGFCGQLNAGGFLGIHLALCAGLVLACRIRGAHAGRDLRQRGKEFRNFWKTEASSRGAGVLLLLVWLGLGGVAAAAHPVVYDALAYRLPRIAEWLQQARIGYLLAEDPRIDYMPFAPDVVTCWLLAPWADGFRPAALTQWLGGGLLLGATAGLARVSGLSRGAAVGAAALVLGMANVAPQFTSVHTDLFTAGIFAAAFYLGLCDLARGRASWLGGLGAGLALGSKGTVLYLGPAVAIWLIACARRYPAPWRAWGGTLVAAAAGGLMFAAPSYWLNLRHYAGPFGPASAVAEHHAGAFVDKVGLNAWTALIQCFDPQSQPWPFRDVARRAGLALAETVPADTRLTWENYNRRQTLQEIMRRDTPDADVTTPGLVSLLLLAIGVVAALRRREEASARLVLAWAGGLLTAFLFFHGMQRWHAFGYRYLVLMAPWLAVIGAWALARMPPRAAKMGWILALAAAASVCWNVNAHALQAGWRAVVAPERAAGFSIATRWGKWVGKLDRPGLEATVALSVNRPLAGFFRRGDARQFRLARVPVAPSLTGEAFARANHGWVIVPATLFIGREGAVVGRTWLDDGDEAGVFSLAAYRVLEPGEIAPPILYRSGRENRGGTSHCSLLVRSSSGKVTIIVHNPRAVDVSFAVYTSASRRDRIVAANREAEVQVGLPVDRVSEVALDFPANGPALTVTVPAVR